MKNRSLIALIALTAAFAVFLTGYIMGSLTDRSIIISDSSPKTDPSGTTISVYIDGKMDINTATISDLIQIPGIGEMIAHNIIAYRENNGPFNTVNDLLQVEGIGEGRLSTLLEYVTVSGG